MSEIEGYRDRVERARQELAALPAVGSGRLGPPDPTTGERWDRSHVLAHLAEMLPYWTEQVRAVLAGGAEMGRTEADWQRRRRALDSAHERTETALRGAVADGIEGLRSLLAAMTDDDLDRQLTFHGHAGDRRLTLAGALEEVLVGHLEAHLRQLAELTPTAGEG
ncbi:MAG TPA: DinB family protein [Candidatus Dormibacteraeota bacterium]|nr:DinB family protein [Candidatus Dormibacteraeota bacterium]